MMKMSFSHAITLGVFAALTVHSRAQTLSADIVFVHNFDGATVGWSARPFLESTGGVDALITSPTGLSGSRTGQSSFSPPLPSFANMQTEATGSPWHLLIDPDGAANPFLLDMAFVGLNESMFGNVELTGPADLFQNNGGSVTFSWTGIAGANHIEFIVQKQDFTLIDFQTMGAGVTSFTPAFQFTEGDYRLTIRYVTPLLNDEVTLSDPYGAQNFAATGIDWLQPEFLAWSEGSYEFSVIPEPSSALLAAVGLFLVQRRSRRIMRRI